MLSQLLSIFSRDFKITASSPDKIAKREIL